ncbi:MAG: hypothetical protein ACREFP_02320 [Acetobacteraceae bacterium]
MTRLTVSPDPAAGPGHALLRVTGAAAAASDPRFRIMHGERERPNLGPRGWQAATARLEPLGATADGADLVLSLGPAVVDELEPGTVEFAMRAAGIAAMPLVWPPNIPTSGPAPPPPPPPPVKSDDHSTGAPAPPLQPTPEPAGARVPVPPRRRVLVGWALAGVFLLALFVGAGFGAWRYLHPARPSPKRPAAQNHAAIPKVPATFLACSGTVAEIMSCAKTPEALYAAGRDLWSSDPNGAFVILQGAIDRGSADAAYFLALRYDPVRFQPGGPIPKPEPREAALDYRIAAHGGVAGAAEHRAALKSWLESHAKAGDIMAPLTLHDFWSKP